MAKLSHPNVVSVYDVEDTPTGVVLVMEYVAGQTLGQWASAEPRRWTEVVDRFLAAGRGLAAAHAEGLIHRDFKPANVLVAASGAVKVTDFGLAKLAAAASGSSVGASLPSFDEAAKSAPDDSLDGRLTQADSILGTPRYMAPEQYLGEALTAHADQYAFCVALWESPPRVPNLATPLGFPVQPVGITGVFRDIECPRGIAGPRAFSGLVETFGRRARGPEGRSPGAPKLREPCCSVGDFPSVSRAPLGSRSRDGEASRSGILGAVPASDAPRRVEPRRTAQGRSNGKKRNSAGHRIGQLTKPVTGHAHELLDLVRA